MRAAIRFLLLLVAALALLAWGASALFNRQALVWAQRDMAMRARLAVSAAGPSLRDATQLASPSCDRCQAATSYCKEAA